MLVIMLAWMSQLCEASFLAVTSTEYLWAVATLSTSIGDFWMSILNRERLNQHLSKTKSIKIRSHPINLNNRHIMALDPEIK